MYKSIYLIVFVASFCSCITLKQKKELVKSTLKDYSLRYPIDKQYLERNQLDGIRPFDISTINALNITDSSLMKLSKRKLKAGLKTWEMALAIVPDSVSRSGVNVDSFYFNQNKIKYIKDNRLLSESIFFYKK